MNIIILSKKYENYQSGYYHNDIVTALKKYTNSFIYGYGYPKYDPNDTIDDVFSKSKFGARSVDLLVCTTSWDDDSAKDNVDPHPRIDLENIKNVYKVYMLNKEYKKLELRLEYIKKNKFDLVCTVLPNTSKWERACGIKFMHLPFGVNFERFKLLALDRKYDFAFTGSLHNTHSDYRFKAKQMLFKDRYLNMLSNKQFRFNRNNVMKDRYNKYNIYWSEFGAKRYSLGDKMGFKSLIFTGHKYVKFLNNAKVFLNTPSALGIINTRFYELMAVKTLIFCPYSDAYGNFLINGKNCIMYKEDMSDFEFNICEAIENEPKRIAIVEEAYKHVAKHSYDERISTLLHFINSV